MTRLLDLRNGQLFGHAAQKVTLACEHGRSTFFLLSGRAAAANHAALDLLWVEHTRRHGCACERTPVRNEVGSPA